MSGKTKDELRKTTEKELFVKVHMSQKKNNKIPIVATACDAHGNKLDDNIVCRTKVSNQKEALTKVDHLVARVVQSYQNKHRPIVENKESKRLFSDAYKSLNLVQRESLCPRTWEAENTRKAHLAYFENTYLPLLDLFGAEIDTVDMQSISDEMKALGEKNMRKNSSKEHTMRNLSVHVNACNALYEAMRRQFNSALPDVSLPLVFVDKAIAVEQCKALTPDVRIGFVTLLERCKAHSYACGGALMQGMIRPAEACALQYADVSFYEDFSTVNIIKQYDGKQVTNILKSVDSYRKILMPYWHTRFLLERKKALKALGYSEDEILTMPIVSQPQDPKELVAPQQLSAYIKKLLTEAGCSPEFWLKVGELVDCEPDYDISGSVNKDPSAYILRRDGCTILCNICGLEPYLVDAMMGHKRPKECKVDWTRYLNNPDNWAELAHKLERFVYHPDYTKNPLFAPVELNEVCDGYKSTLGQIGYTFMASPSNKQPMSFKVQIQSTEIGDTIHMETTGEMKEHTFNAIPLDTAFEPIIGTNPD